MDQPEEGDSQSFANRILQELYPQIPIPFEHQPQNQTAREEAFNKSEIARIMQKVPIKKAPGYDGIDFIVLKTIFRADPDILITFYNKFTLLPTLVKILEKLLLERLNHHLRRNNLQHPNQYGLRTNRSTEEAILDLLDKKNSAKNSNQRALVISLDNKGVFDHLQYTSIKSSLDNLKYHSNTLETLTDILSNRKVAINTSQGPETWNQQQGCPQSSCTLPAFWNMVADEVLQQDWPQGVHLQAFADISSFWVCRLGRNCDYEGIHFDDESYEQTSPPSTIHPALFSLEDRITHGGQVPSNRTPIKVCTDGSKINAQTGSAFCVIENEAITKTWKAKLSPANTVFQAEILALKAAIECANTANEDVNI
ncbi:hypothetical protein AVEN_137223-1 [Araneus ventricosus]|uniref:Reverse transcriptase domain-containing protein n=1 Tax=Araneus ventricosus TaxID=182803 RepID=A0A4Y2IUU2_ARAVE|nr:hypothetical protein AVEN_137223-1 [Araneus ventricosus]